MIAFLISVLLLWLAWRWLRRSMHVVEIAPPAPTAINVMTPPLDSPVSQQCPGEKEAKVFSTVPATRVIWAR